MLRITFTLFVFFMLSFPIFSQEVVNLSNSMEIETAQKKNVVVERLFGDSLSTSFLISVKDTVKTHKHQLHSETVYIISGRANIYLNNVMQNVKTGDVIFIPKNTWHAVKVIGDKPLQVLSVQAPGFDGTDRVFKDDFERNKDK